MKDLKIGDEVYIHGFVDEVRSDTVIIKNEGGYFGTVTEEIIPFSQPEREHTRKVDITKSGTVGTQYVTSAGQNGWVVGIFVRIVAER